MISPLNEFTFLAAFTAYVLGGSAQASIELGTKTTSETGATYELFSKYPGYVRVASAGAGAGDFKPFGSTENVSAAIQFTIFASGAFTILQGGSDWKVLGDGKTWILPKSSPNNTVGLWTLHPGSAWADEVETDYIIRNPDGSISDTINVRDTSAAQVRFGPATEVVVPEPSTYVAGALVLLPMAAQALRFVRKQRVA